MAISFKIKACFGYRHLRSLLSPQLPTKYVLHDSILINNSIGPNYIGYVNVSCKSAWLGHCSPSPIALVSSSGATLSHPLPTEEAALWGPGSRTRAEHCTPQSGAVLRQRLEVSKGLVQVGFLPSISNKSKLGMHLQWSHQPPTSSPGSSWGHLTVTHQRDICVEQLRTWSPEPDCLGSNSSSTTQLLCDLGQFA